MLYLRIFANEIFLAGPILLAGFRVQLVGWDKLRSTDELLFLDNRRVYASTIFIMSPNFTLSFLWQLSSVV